MCYKSALKMLHKCAPEGLKSDFTFSKKNGEIMPGHLAPSLRSSFWLMLATFWAPVGVFWRDSMTFPVVLVIIFSKN